jgi:hypothetical protein
VAGSCEHDNNPSVSIKGGEYADLLSDCQLLNKDHASCSTYIYRCIVIPVLFVNIPTNEHQDQCGIQCVTCIPGHQVRISASRIVYMVYLCPSSH